jgi:hypothetical protein
MALLCALGTAMYFTQMIYVLAILQLPLPMAKLPWNGQTSKILYVKEVFKFILAF